MKHFTNRRIASSIAVAFGLALIISGTSLFSGFAGGMLVGFGVRGVIEG